MKGTERETDKKTRRTKECIRKRKGEEETRHGGRDAGKVR
jgi:hypothetical protein